MAKEYIFRTNSIHSELELIAGEFEAAIPAKKEYYAAGLLWFMERYPNAELHRVLGIVKKNFLDEGQPEPVRRKCAEMLGEIGASNRDLKTTSEILELLLIGMGNRDPHMACECIESVGRMARARRWQEFDGVIFPLLERIVDTGSPNESPNILDSAISALAAIKPNDPKFLDDINEAREELLRKKKRQGQRDGWDSKARMLEKIRQEWAALLIQRGKWGEKKAGIPAPGESQQGNGARQGKRRKIVRHIP